MYTSFFLLIIIDPEHLKCFLSPLTRCASLRLTHLHFYALVEFLAGGRYGLGGAELEVPQLVLHSEGEREESEDRRVPRAGGVVCFGCSGHILKLSGAAGRPLDATAPGSELHEAPGASQR